MATVQLRFATKVSASAEEVWAWSTSISGIKSEMWPILKMTFPNEMTHIGVDTPLSKPLCRCKFLLFGIFPIDVSKLTFVELEPGRRFVEQSPLLSMRSWRHERVVTPADDGACVTDCVEFSPRFASPIVAWFVARFFGHRHAVLSRSLRGASGRHQPCSSS